MAKKKTKSAGKKAVAPKKAVKKAAAKKVAKKAVVKKAAKKAAVKKVVKKVAVKKAAKPAKKTAVKKAAPKKVVKTVVKKTAKKIVKAAKKVAPAKKSATVKKAKVAVKPAVKPAKKVTKAKFQPKKAVKPVAKKAAKVAKKITKAVSKPVAKPVVTKKATKPATPKSGKSIVAKPSTVKKSVVADTKKVKTAPKPLKPVVSTTPVFETKPEDAPAIPVNTLRYSDSELNEFRDLINKKLNVAREELNNLMEQMQNPGLNGGADTDNAYNKLDDGSSTSEKEYLSQLAARQRKFIENLENALIRIENKTYGICKVTGKLISKERLRAVPHTTLSMEAKLQQYK